jgi:hypothetical protein
MLTSITYTIAAVKKLPASVKHEANALAWALEAEFERNHDGAGDFTIAITHRVPFNWAGDRKDTAVPGLAAAIMPSLSGAFVDACIPDVVMSKTETVHDVLAFVVGAGIGAHNSDA